jgi:hypothetical protein
LFGVGWANQAYRLRSKLDGRNCHRTSVVALGCGWQSGMALTGGMNRESKSSIKVIAEIRRVEPRRRQDAKNSKSKTKMQEQARDGHESS